MSHGPTSRNPGYGARSGAGGDSDHKRVLVALSGGLNSSVTAALLKSQGHEVMAVYFQLQDPKLPEAKRFASRCCLTKRLASAEEVARKLSLSLHVVHVETLFEDKVVDYFVHELLRLRLPNPCLPCNRDIRFEALFKEADRLGCELVATGHHAQVFHESTADPNVTAARLQRAVNAVRDQSYFLYGLNQKQLLRILMPLGGFQDAMILRLAREFGLPENADSRQQEVCLARVEDYEAFVEAKIPINLRPKGVLKTHVGTVVGDHRGVHAYQVGSKPKLAVPMKDADQYQVVGFEQPLNALIVGLAEERLFSEARASAASWMRPIDSLHGLKCTARMSPSQVQDVPCRVTLFENATLRVQFEQPQSNLISGQAIVFYENDEVLGGALLEVMGSLPRDDGKK